jgi:hypothetical protein
VRVSTEESAQLGAMLWRFRHKGRATSSPIWTENLVIPLAALAKAFGVRPYYER